MNFFTRCFNRNLTTETRESRGNQMHPNCVGNGEMATGMRNSRQEKEVELIKTLKEKDLDIEKIKDLIANGQADINACDKSQNTVLHLAILKMDNNNIDHVKFIRFLIENGADLNARNKGDETPFLFAVRKNKFSLINLFVENTQNDINAVNRDGDNALHVAVKHNHKQCVWMLHKHSITYGLRENKTNNVNLTPEGIARASDYKVMPDILEILETPPDELKQEPQLRHNLSVQSLDSADNNVTCRTGHSGDIKVYVSGDATAFVGNNQIITDTGSIDLKTHLQLGNSANSPNAITNAQEPMENPVNGAQAIEGGRELTHGSQPLENLTNGSQAVEHSWQPETTQVTEQDPTNGSDPANGSDPTNGQQAVETTEESDLRLPLPVENSAINAESVEVTPAKRTKDPYVMNAKPRGICLVIKNEHFDKDSKLSDRTGCQKDVDNLKETFERLLSFKFEVEEDLTAYKMLKKLKEYAKMDHSQYNCFVACILSHGCAGAIYGFDGKTLDVKTILQLFSGENAETLADKPKLFFFNCCREREAVSDGPNLAVADKKVPPAPDRNDIFVGYSCPDGFPSWRYKDAESWYITELCRALSEQAENTEFQHIMLSVNNKMSEYNEQNNITQISSSANQLRKQLWFFPKKR